MGDGISITLKHHMASDNSYHRNQRWWNVDWDIVIWQLR